MSLQCPSCLKTLEYLGERPTFCSYCGVRLPAPTADQETVSFVGEPSTVGRVPVPGSAPALPERVAGYRLGREIGRGGMGIVFEGEEISSGRKVAVKLLSRDQIGSSVAIDRFVQEGRLASSISHPRCVFVLAADEDDGWPFIVMELMPGTTLKDLVDGVGALPQSEAVAKILDVIDGLSEAHRLGVIHRDVKPSNCLLDSEGRVKVGDFGLSRSIASENRLTVTGSFLGTPHFSSPEQIKGEATDEASDVYSVAATLYYLLTGRPPFDSKDAAVALAKIVSETPPSIRSLRKKVSASLEQVVMKGLERDRRRRYRDLDEFREALQPFLADSLTIGGVWLRLAAGLIDLGLAAVATVWIGAVLPFVFKPDLVGSAPPFPIHRALNDFQILLGVLIATLLVVTEVFGRCSPGKRIARLRIESSDGGPPSWRRVAVRYSVFVIVALMPLSAFLAAHSDWTSLAAETWFTVMVQGLAFAALFVTARPDNGFRGIHELLSGTAVVRADRLPLRRRRPGLRTHSHVGSSLNRPHELPQTIGPYQTEGILRDDPDCRVYLGRDGSLGRGVWIVVKPEGSDGPAQVRHQIDRQSRPRWLSSGVCPQGPWDAYLAPVGLPLTALVDHEGPLQWLEARTILLGLAEELVEAEAEGTLPETLYLDQVWIQHDGSVQLVDVSVGPVPAAAPARDGERSWRLLRDVAAWALNGQAVPDSRSLVATDRPVPLHALTILERLRVPHAPAETLARLDACKGEPTRLDWLDCVAVGGSYLAWTIVALILSLAPLFLFIPRIYEGMLLPGEWRFFRQLWIGSLSGVVAFFLIEGLIVPGGLIARSFGMALVDRHGRPANWIRGGFREVLGWFPLVLVAYLVALNYDPSRGFPETFLNETRLILVYPIFVTLHSVIYPGRLLHDRLAGTYRVIR